MVSVGETVELPAKDMLINARKITLSAEQVASASSIKFPDIASVSKKVYY